MKSLFPNGLRRVASLLLLGFVILGCGDPQPEPKTLEQEVEQLQDIRQRESGGPPSAPAARPKS